MIVYNYFLDLFNKFLLKIGIVFVGNNLFMYDDSTKVFMSVYFNYLV